MSRMLGQGPIQKMQNSALSPVGYELPIGDQLLAMNELIGQRIQIEFDAQISCSHCGRKTKKSFGQGHCYPCFKKLASCDSCIMSPEKCHFDAGTCREPDWAEQFCFKDHYVYLANSSGLKVGITRGTQIPTRWMDQGAVSALPIYRVSNRRLSGLVETVFKQYTNDKTNWRAMLKGEVPELDLLAEAQRLKALAKAEIDQLQSEFGLNAIVDLDDAELYEFEYPVSVYPVKITSFNLDKNPIIEGELKGIKGQYLILDGGVINLRKYSSYHLNISVL